MRYESLREQCRAMLSSGGVEAITRAREACEAYLDNPSTTERDRGMALGYLAELLTMESRLGEADDAYQAALRLVSDPSDLLTVWVGYAELVIYGRWYRELNRVNSEIYELLMNKSDHIGHLAVWGYATHSRLACFGKEYAIAVSSARSAVDCAARYGGAGAAEAYSALADALRLGGEVETAIEALEMAMAHMTGTHCLLYTRVKHGRLLIDAGDLHGAQQSLARALERPDVRDRRVMAEVFRAIAALGEQDAQAAVRLVLQLAVHFESCDVPMPQMT